LASDLCAVATDIRVKRIAFISFLRSWRGSLQLLKLVKGSFFWAVRSQRRESRSQHASQLMTIMMLARKFIIALGEKMEVTRMLTICEISWM
jgi:hypothetical protein